MSHYVSGNIVKNLKGGSDWSALFFLLKFFGAIALLMGCLYLIGLASKPEYPMGFLCPQYEGVVHGAMSHRRVKKARIVRPDMYWLNAREVSRAEFMKCTLVELPHP